MPALLGWGVAAVVVGGSSVAALVVSVMAVLVAGIAVGLPRLRSVALVAVCVGAIAASCAWRLGQTEHSPFLAMAENHRLATLDVEVTRDARVFTRFGRDAGVVGVRVLRATAGDVTVAARDTATAFVDGPTDDLVVGRRLTIVGRLAPPGATSEAATIDVIRRSPTRPAAWWWEGSERVRAGVRNAVAHTGTDQSALVPALVDGDDQRVSERVQEEFRRSGLTHLLAVSGTNLTIVLAVVLVVARSIGAPRRLLLVLGLASVVGFVMLARPDPSVVRAAGMGVVGLVALGLGTRGGMRALSVAILALLFIDPWLSRSLGFVLSVCATAGILLAAPPLSRRLERWMPRWCALAVAVPIAAQLACTPAIAAISGEVSLVAVFANVLAGPLVAPATIAGLAGGLLDLVSAPVARVPGTVAGWSVTWILAVGHHAASLSGASLGWQAPWWLLIVLVPLAFALIWRLARHPAVVIGLAVGLGLGMWRPPQVGWPPDGWVMVACDVGQGDATAVDTGEGAAMLVDAGPEPAAVDRCLDRLRVDRLSVVAITHAHADHMDGWSGAVTGRDVGALLVGPTGGPRESSIQAQRVAAGQSFSVGRVSVEVLWPPTTAADDRGSDGSAMNDASLVLRVTVRTDRPVRLLLTGDVEPDAQEALLRQHPDLAADVLKVPHHGSGRQSTRFFDAVGARVATISAGEDNDYGHPAAAALELLRDHRVAWWRTDTDGDIAVVMRDGRLSVVTR
ncbi:ComEC/Rec2 family competence protein [Aeromicrobium sp.]|uniref:ComEC/Rec2 family competence protein n=1 Tax=Aeromicrobium sp. TaxID=1871063 RepID=UPI003D6A1C8A